MEDAKGNWLRNIVKEASILQSEVDSLRADWNPEMPPDVIVFATLGRNIAKHWESIRKDSLNRIIERIEEAIGGNDESLRDAVATGLVEALMAEAGEHKGLWEEIEPLLGAKTRKYALARRSFGSSS